MRLINPTKKYEHDRRIVVNKFRLSIGVLLVTVLFLSTPLAMASSQLVVKVVDDSGPVGGASVATLSEGVSVTATTGSDGYATFSLPEDEYTFTVWKEGYARKSVRARVGVDNNVTISLDRLYGLSGIIVDASTGQPVKDASITVTDKVTGEYYTGSSDSGGVFTIMVPDGYYSVLVRANGYKTISRDNSGAGYHVLDNSLYIGYLPVPMLSSDTGNPEGVSLYCDFPGKSVKPNETVTFDVKITNDGVVDRTYTLTVKEAPKNWDVKFYTGSDIINRVFVERGGSKTFQVKATPRDAGVITIMAASGADSCSLQLFVDTGGADYKLELSCSDNLTLEAGASKTLEVLVRNNGSGRLTSVGVDVEDVPDSLTVEPPTRIEALGPGETHRFNLRVQAKPDAAQETSTLNLRATSTETKTGQKTVEISITKSNTWIGVGLGIAVLAMLAFGLIVWKYGRR
ncbi:carboxypeptidase regulatory-like domain-containing protein [Methanocella conradii]|uniref:carboxypeptidase regulatory-like domain-containing protein n=1 Tax=Methanocella conradii TaxID=1175444 RepID=UPI0024B3C4B4|nr:carboxypeptidase regulatory-like domain-containing protein [Methanocella conradii]MDI6898050.1 carboxypeptidase regulatory-like domain-containing protein [Methanocella conradii]